MARPRNSLLPAIVLIAVGAGLLIAGLVRGEGYVVLQKAIRICLECIGIG
ncbi:hypothetical protein LJC74_09385 [Eubacteriales bacterium OttesenSCG-928-A19]|nr:hypothetical protein [Eubacteriales bacterium OttesenSCG-928-A19]